MTQLSRNSDTEIVSVRRIKVRVQKRLYEIWVSSADRSHPEFLEGAKIGRGKSIVNGRICNFSKVFAYKEQVGGFGQRDFVQDEAECFIWNLLYTEWTARCQCVTLRELSETIHRRAVPAKSSRVAKIDCIVYVICWATGAHVSGQRLYAFNNKIKLE